MYSISCYQCQTTRLPARGDPTFGLPLDGVRPFWRRGCGVHRRAIERQGNSQSKYSGFQVRDAEGSEALRRPGAYHRTMRAPYEG